MSVLFLMFAMMTAPQASSAEVRLIEHRYADCVTKRNADEARTYILDHLEHRGSLAMGRLLAKLTNGSCLVKAAGNVGGSMRFGGDSMRYALADSLIRRELLTALPVAAGTAIAPLAHSKVDVAAFMASPIAFDSKEAQAERERRLAVLQAVSAMSELGECIVRRSPAQALQLFRTSPGSAEEGAAFAALNPAVAQCVSSGLTLELTKASLRGTVAVNYYRLANAPRVAAATAGSAR